MNGYNQGAGAAWVFARSGATVTQLGPKLLPNDGTPPSNGYSYFGTSVALSADGNTALIGGTGDNNGLGAAWVFTRSGSTFSQQGAKLTPNDAARTVDIPYIAFGTSVALSADGSTALIGGSNDNAAVGAVWVFARSGSTYTQQGSKLTPSDETPSTYGGSEFGTSVALSGDGNAAVIGGPSDNNSAGAAWVFTRSGSTFTQQGAKLTPNDAVGQPAFGDAVAISADGSTALIGGPEDNLHVGAAWVFARSGVTFTQQGPKLSKRSGGRRAVVKGSWWLQGILRCAPGRAPIGDRAGSGGGD